MNLRVSCSSPQDVYQAIDEGDIPVIEDSMVLNVSTKCSIIIKKGPPRINIFGDVQPYIQVWGESNPNFWVFGSSRPYIDLFDTSSPLIISCDFSSPFICAGAQSSPVILAKQDSTPNINCKDNSQAQIETLNRSVPIIGSGPFASPSIKARGDSQPLIRSQGASKVFVHDRAKPTIFGEAEIFGQDLSVVVRILGRTSQMGGYGKELRLVEASPIAWSKVFEIPLVDEKFLYLYKALGQDFQSSKGKVVYLPGTTCEAPDWDPIPECGGGLHFSPTPKMAKVFYPEAKKFVACKVKIDEILVHPNGDHPEKVKAPRVYEIFEVDLLGNRV